MNVGINPDQDELWFFWVGVILGVLTQVALDYFGWWPA